MLKRGETRTKAFKEVVKQMRALSSTQIKDPNFLRMKDLRYADDWIVGVGGSHALAEDLKVRIKTFLGERLKLTRSRGKDLYHQHENGRSLLPGDPSQHWEWWRGQDYTANQLPGDAPVNAAQQGGKP
jgi:hypothetical protein